MTDEPRRCPECEIPLKGNAKTCRCGWRDPSAAAPTRAATTNGRQQQATDQRCAWLSNGHQCRYFGALSLSTHGGGPYYCRGHFACEDQEVGARVVLESAEVMGDLSDWSAQTLVERTRREFLARAPVLRGEAHAKERVAGFKPLIVAAGLRVPDPEGDLEREALQGDA